jgi:response regulator of citrate/malate metabolism
MVRWTRGKDADGFIRTHQPDLVLLDLWLEDRESGARLLACRDESGGRG